MKARAGATPGFMLDAERGRRAFDNRASVAKAWRRRDAGEEVDACSGCGAEVDVAAPAHDPRCKIEAGPGHDGGRGRAAVPASKPSPLDRGDG